MVVTLNGVTIGVLSECNPTLGDRNIVQPAFPSQLTYAPNVYGNKVKELEISIHVTDFENMIAAVDTRTYTDLTTTISNGSEIFYGDVTSFTGVINDYSGDCDLQNSGMITLRVTVVG
jgi:hypothetical protein